MPVETMSIAYFISHPIAGVMAFSLLMVTLAPTAPAAPFFVFSSPDGTSCPSSQRTAFAQGRSLEGTGG
jgi:hypothetical protein